MTYRMDSDIVHPYGWFDPINLSIIPIHEYRKWMNSNKDNNSGNYAGGKTKFIVFFTFFCKLKLNREEFVITLFFMQYSIEKN